MENTIANIHILDVVRLVHGRGFTIFLGWRYFLDCFRSKFKSQNLYNTGADPSLKLFDTTYNLESTSSLKK
jgi:hypothetical protein